MTLTQIISNSKEIVYGILGRSYFQDRDAYYQITNKKFGGISDLTFDTLGAAYTYAHLPLWLNFFNSFDSSNFKYAAIASAVRVAAPFAFKKLADYQFNNPRKSWDNGVNKARPLIGLQAGEYPIAKGLFDEIQEQGSNCTIKAIILQRFSDFRISHRN